MRESAAQIAEIAPPGAVRSRASGWLAVAARDGLSTLQRALDSAESSIAIRVMVWFSLASAYTFFVVNYSLLHGKMLIYPTYDDVEYLLDGLRRLEVFQSEGLVRGLLNLIGNPPHSPY